MSNGRKIFRFLKFVEDLKKFMAHIFDSTLDIFAILKAFNYLSSCFYHFLDNLVWASNVGMIDRVITGDINWKTSKNIFSIIRTLIKITSSIIDFTHTYQSSSLENIDNIEDEEYEKLVNATIKSRSKLRVVSIDITQSLLKLTTSLYSLKFQPITSLFHPIIVSFCGIAYCAISLFKIYLKISMKQRKLVKNYRSTSSEGLNLKSGENLIYNNKILNNKENPCVSYNMNFNQTFPTTRGLRSYFEISCLEHIPNHRVLSDESYFDNYYIDFNKDYPMVPELVLKANGGDFRKINE